MPEFGEPTFSLPSPAIATPHGPACPLPPRWGGCPSGYPLFDTPLDPRIYALFGRLKNFPANFFLLEMEQVLTYWLFVRLKFSRNGPR